MLARTRRILALILLFLVMAPALPSAAKPACGYVDEDGICIVDVNVPGGPPAGIPGPGGPGEGAPGAGSGGGGSGGGPSADPCTYRLATPPPPTSDPVWGGNTPEDGAIYIQSCPSPLGFGYNELIFVANGAVPVPVVDPRVLAEQAIKSMTMLAPPIGMMPPQGSEGAITGVPVWAWVTPGVTSTGPQTASVSAGAVTVTAVATVTEVKWDMGDGSVITCGIGTPYDPSYGGDPSPTCGYVYEVKSTKDDPNGVYTVTATSTWTITWSGGGQSGVEVLQLDSSVPLRVTEINVLNVPGG